MRCVSPAVAGCLLALASACTINKGEGGGGGNGARAVTPSAANIDDECTTGPVVHAYANAAPVPLAQLQATTIAAYCKQAMSCEDPIEDKYAYATVGARSVSEYSDSLLAPSG